VCGVPPVGPICDVALRNRRREPRRLTDGPVGQQSAAAAPGDAELLLVDVTALDQIIYSCHQVLVIVAGIVVLDDVAEILAVARAAAWIRIKHDVALRSHPLK